jgi:hypothetical protein
VSGAAPGSFWDAAVVHCPLLFVVVEHSCQRLGERLMKTLDNLPPDAALMLTARSLARPASTGARGS